MFQNLQNTEDLLSIDEWNLPANNSKAFDTIHHQILLYQLENTDLRDTKNCVTLLSWIATAVCNRNRPNSNLAVVKYRVPQGSLLGPLLYNIYVCYTHYIVATKKLLKCCYFHQSTYDQWTLSKLKSTTTSNVRTYFLVILIKVNGIL